ncbi:MAG: hypothetical protein J5721_01670, partial [Lachnospiraceae bacterium]|nr:hypothetical protein [Lachnospiraceae bacterium]
VTTGAANDIERATDIARNMITRYGMSKKFGLMGLATIESQYLEGRTALNCSDATAADVDSEVVALLKESYDKALELLRANRELMDKIAAFLIEKETITGKEFMEIFRKEKGLPEPEEKPGKQAAEEPKKSEEELKKPEEEATAPKDTVAVVGESIFDRKSIFEEKTDEEPGKDAQEETKTEPPKPPYLREEPPADDRPVGRFSQRKLDE